MSDSLPDPLREAIVAEILARMADDVSRGDMQQLPAYLDQFPEHGSLVSELYAKVIAGESTRLVTPDMVPGASWPKGLGSLKLLEQIESGGQGTVFLAEDTEDQVRQLFAVKVLNDPLLRSEESAQRLVREARLLAELRHDNICRLHKLLWAEDGRPCLVLNYIEGESLIRRVRAPGKHRNSPDAPDVGDPEEIWRRVLIVGKVARALHYAHQRSIIHRDVKPSNIMVRADGSPSLIDFGLARRSAGEAWLTATLGLGTPPYMSPEQVSGSEGSLDHRTDIWSLGVTLYVLLTGHLPFAAHNPTEVQQRILREEPLNPRRLNASITRDMQTIIAKAMEKDLRRRYASAADFADDLHRSMNGLPVRARRPTLAYRSWRWATRNRALATSAMIIVLGLGTGTAIVSNQVAARFEAHRKTAAAQEELRFAHLDALFMLGRRHSALGDWPSAINTYRQALDEGHPDPVAVQLELILALGVSRRTKELDGVVQVIEADGGIPSRHRGRYLLLQGYLLHDRLRTRDAGVDLLREALEWELPDADREFCRAYLAENIEEVRNRLDAAIATDPAHRLARELRTATLVFSGDIAEASHAVGGFRSLYPNDGAGLLLEAFLHARAGDRNALDTVLAAAGDVLGERDHAALRNRCAFISAICSDNLVEPLMWPYFDSKLEATVRTPALSQLVPLLLRVFKDRETPADDALPADGFLMPPAILGHYEGAMAIALELPGLSLLLRMLGAGSLLRDLASTTRTDLGSYVRANQSDALLQTLWAGRCFVEDKLDEAEQSLLFAMEGRAIMDLGRISSMLACLPPFMRFLDARKAGDAQTAESERQLVRSRLSRIVLQYTLTPWQCAELSTLAKLTQLEELELTFGRLSKIAEGK